MAAFDTPFMTAMTEPSSTASGGNAQDHGDGKSPHTVAAFSPHYSHSSSNQRRSTILVHHKSPLLLATPPQVTRALAYSHPFILPLNKLAGLLSWTTGDPWESFLLVAAFWFMVLYGDEILRYTGPLILVAFLILGMYFRRYSPLSSSDWTGERQKTHKREPSEAQLNHRKSLDDILSTLQTCTTRCNILLEPMLALTDFLSTQQTATSATTRPALTALFIRILLASPVWAILTLPPLRIITARRIVFVVGTLIMTWHSRPARISRSILWRSRTVRQALGITTGLNFVSPPQTNPGYRAPSNKATTASAAALAMRHGTPGEGIRFTFSLYENQRRWIGLGWTHNMIAYERTPWTDEHLNATDDPETFKLPQVEGGFAKWRWAEGSEWQIEVPRSDSSSSKDKNNRTAAKAEDENAWVYYDNKWADGHRGQDSWSRYTRRRKWVRDAELVDIIPSPSEKDKGKEHNRSKSEPKARLNPTNSEKNNTDDTPYFTGSDAGSMSPSTADQKRRSWFGRTAGPGDDARPPLPADSKATLKAQHKKARRTSHSNSNSSVGSSMNSQQSGRSRAASDYDDVPTPTARLKQREADWGLGDDVTMGLG